MRQLVMRHHRKYKEWFLFEQNVQRGRGVSCEPSQPLAVHDYISSWVHMHIPMYAGLNWAVVIIC